MGFLRRSRPVKLDEIEGYQRGGIASAIAKQFEIGEAVAPLHAITSPSMMQERTASALTAATSVGKRHPQSSLRRDMRRTRAPS
jgi:hypothetical protein